MGSSSNNRRFQPARNKLDKAISDILDKAVNADSENASRQLRSILLTENPKWKLPERRVARYLKRHLKARKHPLAEQIEADMDEETVFTMISSSDAAGSKTADTYPIPILRNRINNVEEVKDEELKNSSVYTDENEVAAPKEKISKPLFCEGLQCVIS